LSESTTSSLLPCSAAAARLGDSTMVESCAQLASAMELRGLHWGHVVLGLMRGLRGDSSWLLGWTTHGEVWAVA
jgi:hypothetical protein